MNKSSFDTAAYAGSGWQPRDMHHEHEVGIIWRRCGIENEYADLRSVVLHSPGDELNASQQDPDAVQMLEPVDLRKAREEHDQLVESYSTNGVEVLLLNPRDPVKPNQMFCADLFAMTPQGAILARPASVVRAGEEVQMARFLANQGVPILATLTGDATFEGADLIWLNEKTAFLGQGLRTNASAAAQISTLFEQLGYQLMPVDMPFGTMHLMGMIRIVDRDLAIAWPRRTPHRLVMALRESGYQVAFLPESDDFEYGKAFNIVTLSPRKVLMVAGNKKAIIFYESLGIECIESPATELSKAAGAVGCLTGVLHRAFK